MNAVAVSMTGAQAPPTREQIADVEAAIGYDVPERYKEFLKEFNGAIPQENIFDFPGGAKQSCVHEFLPLSEVVDVYNSGNFDKHPTLLPIAVDSTGNFICTSLGEDRAGEVYFLDHELTDDPAGVSRLAGSIPQFLEMLQPFDPSTVELEPGQVKFAWIDPEFLKANQREE
jgi:cell wall assembly regulator SMI1